MNFLDALNTRAGDFEKPPTLPVGTYVWKVQKAHKEGDAGKGEYKTVDIPIVALHVDEESNDVDPELLEAYGTLNKSSNSIRFMFPTDAAKQADLEATAYRLRIFLLEVLKVDGNEDSTLKELLAASIGCEFRAQASHRIDGDKIYVDVKNWMPAAN